MRSVREVLKKLTIMSCLSIAFSKEIYNAHFLNEVLMQNEVSLESSFFLS